MKIALALFLIFAAWTPAKAIDAIVFTPVVANPETGIIARFFPYEDLSKEECIARMNSITAKLPAKVFCVGHVVKREFC
jgi:hypothetical protein